MIRKLKLKVRQVIDYREPGVCIMSTNVVEYPVKPCYLADSDHLYSKRQYAHVGHFHDQPNVICVCSDFYYIPVEHQFGILAHEIGHLLFNGISHSEEEADILVYHLYGVKIKYRDTEYGERLQYLDDETLQLGIFSLSHEYGD